MFAAAVKVLSAVLSIVNKLLPSWEWWGGRAAAERDQMKEAADAKARMDAVPAPDDIVERLRKHDF